MAHCLVKAVQTMAEDHPAITSLHRATYGMVFLGIPHKGLVVEDIQQMLAGDGKHPREKLLQQISSKSDLLVHQLADFKNLTRDRKVVSFYETEADQTASLGHGLPTVETHRGLHHDCQRRFGSSPASRSCGGQGAVACRSLNDGQIRHAECGLVSNSAGQATTVRQRCACGGGGPHRRVTGLSHAPQCLFKKDLMFVGREIIISAITEKHAAIGKRHERVALVGLAGVLRKTQIAIEYSYRLQQIATVAEIPGWDNPKANILQLVYQWLCDESNGRWMMMLDNADDDQIFFCSDDTELV
ncbi:hypothetical protein EYB25_003897 [Talaromyces marneffei]|uniref:uncharacterized protein n=1 Tax=Talaromyces marneffei TaxID=37727 RepID=UPI0012A89BD1|nr:uncharacterized protein EYB26_005013 [Talaromyces marneffei]KAE8552519.1 hypothetical protein EYB25_003897 [Talaromyces marneffei]QGA17342.1 hypothetical protein EYB26_005013 [Talaromyces marneffei]